jgi:hypothetical protein
VDFVAAVDFGAVDCFAAVDVFLVDFELFATPSHYARSPKGCRAASARGDDTGKRETPRWGIGASQPGNPDSVGGPMCWDSLRPEHGGCSRFVLFVKVCTCTCASRK